MKLKFLGKGACFYPAFYNTSAYFVYKDNLILIDCGETVYERLLETEKIDSYKNIYVVITHLHADHVGSLGSLISYCAYILKKKITVVHPEYKLCELLTLMGIDDNAYIYVQEFGSLIEGLKITKVNVQHAVNMKCYGYEIEYDDVHIYYSGDASNLPKEILDGFLNRSITDVYQDTSTHDLDSASHMYFGKLEELIPSELRKHVYCMHLDCDCCNDLKNRGFSIAGQ